MDQDAEFFVTAEDFTEVVTDSEKNFYDRSRSHDDGAFVGHQASEDVSGKGFRHARSDAKRSSRVPLVG
jgi:hypothetical protein